MDYVVFGLGFGATLLVLGLLIRDIGPRLRFRNPADDGVFHAEELVARVSWGRFCSALGTVWAIAGLAFVIATGICMLFVVSDNTAGWVMGVSLLVLTLLMAFWTWAYFDRFGSYGILPERERAGEFVGEPLRSGSTQKVGAGASAATVGVADDGRAVTANNRGEGVQHAPEPGLEGEGAEATDASVAEPGSPPGEDERSESPARDPQALQTPEERIAAATTPLDHESLEADLDMLADANNRPGRRSFRPAAPPNSPEGDPADEEAPAKPSVTEGPERNGPEDDEQSTVESPPPGPDDAPPRQS